MSRSCQGDNSGLMCLFFLNMLLFMFKIIGFSLVTLLSQLRVMVGILLTCEENLQDRIISPRGEVWAHISTLIPPPFHCSVCTIPEKWAVMHLCVRCIGFASFYEFSIGFLELFAQCDIFFFISSSYRYRNYH